MGSMPNWFAKTKEMAAFDRYFSLLDVDEKALLERYWRRWHARWPGATSTTAPTRSSTSGAAKPNLGLRAAGSRSTRTSAATGSTTTSAVIPRPARRAAGSGPRCRRTAWSSCLRTGMIMAIHKAMGDTELANLGLPEDYRDRLWKAERENDIDFDDGVRGIALSWNCVAPAGDNFFEVDALRGPTVVEFAIATPRPYGHGSVMGIAEDAQAGIISLRPSPESQA